MEILNQYNFTEFMKFIPTIKEDIESWRIIETSLSGETNHNILFIAKRLQLYFADNNMDGKLFICNSKEILALARTGKAITPQRIKKELIIYLPEYSCDIITAEVNVHEIETIKLKLEDITREEEKKDSKNLRRDRNENVLMIADDDMFMRSLAMKALKPYGTVVQAERGNEVLDTYLEHLPDIIFLDIHMPGASGIEVLDEILSFDHDAFIIMLSADSNKNNVVSTNIKGAKGFVTKPFTEERLLEFVRKCPTIRKTGKLLS